MSAHCGERACARTVATRDGQRSLQASITFLCNAEHVSQALGASMLSAVRRCLASSSTAHLSRVLQSPARRRVEQNVGASAVTGDQATFAFRAAARTGVKTKPLQCAFVIPRQVARVLMMV